MPETRTSLPARRRRSPVVLFAALVLLSPALGAEPPQRTHEITVDDYLSVYLITTCRTAPGGQQVAFTELRWWDRDEARSTDLWVVEPATGRATRLTFERGNEDTPQWGPDGDRLYFITKRSRGDKKPPYDGSRQVWVMGTQPGEPLPVTRVKGGIEGYQLSQDGRTLYYAKEGEEAEQEWKELRKKYADIKFGDGPVKYTEIWKLDLETWREEKVVSQERVVTEFKVSPDQRRVAMITTPDGRLITKEGQSRVDIYDTQTKEITTPPDQLWRADAPTPYGWLENLAWASDSAALAFTVDFDGYPGELFCTEPRGDEWHVWRLRREGEIHHAGQLEFRPGGRDLCFLAQDHARQRVYCVRDVRDGRQGTTDLLTPGDIVVHGLSFAADGSGLAVIVSTPVHMPDVYWLDLRKPDAGLTRLTRINPQIDAWKLPQISVVSWQAADGATVDGILELPPDYKPGDGPLPMVVELHGGPTDATLIAMRYWIYGRTIFAAKGYALLSPNYRGSTGYGDKFMTDLIGREADIEVQDVLAGVDAMVERRIADPERLGVVGWSNGGFVANALITTTTRFKAASTGAGVVDQFLQWGLEDTPGHVINYMRGLPWERAEAYIKASPAYKLGQVTTPTIIHVGEQDSRVPAAHARALYRALKEYTKTPTVLLVYPGAGHGLAISDHRKGKLDWDVAWFERYMRGQTQEPPEEEK